MKTIKRQEFNVRAIALALSLILITGFPLSAYAAEDEPAGESSNIIPYVGIGSANDEFAAADELLVLVEKGTSGRKIDAIADEAGASVDNVSVLGDGSKMAKISIDETDEIQEVANCVMSENAVLVVQPNYKYSIDNGDAEAEPVTEEKALYRGTARGLANDDDLTSYQWYMGASDTGAIHAYEGWNRLNSNNEVIVAVIDSGADLNNPDLSDVIDKDKCVSFNDGEQYSFEDIDGKNDDDGHGSHVCGIIAARAGDSYGIAGVANNRARLIVIDAELDGYFSTEDLVLAIGYAVKNQARVINMSLGSFGSDLILEKAVNDAYGKGVLCICAAGNEASRMPSTPSDSTNAISVMAHGESGSRSYFTNYGEEKDVSAPGEYIYSCLSAENYPGGYEAVYDYKSGTSMAAPMVSGLAALLLSEDPKLNPRELKNLIYTSSGTGNYSNQGFGRINVKNAIDNLKGSPVPASVVLNKTEASLYAGERISLEYAVYPGSASRYADELKFESNNPTVATVDAASGIVTANSTGTAVITATCGSTSSVCTVSVKDIPCERIGSLPFKGTRYLSYTDPKSEINQTRLGQEISLQVFSDRYELNAAAGDIISINISTGEFLPHLRLLSEDNTVLAESSPYAFLNVFKTNLIYHINESGKYIIELLGEETGLDADALEDKSYTINVAYTYISDADVSGIGSRTYNGKAQTQNPLVVFAGTRLIEGVDYTLAYRENVKPGTAYVIIQGQGNYTGSKTVPFTINKKKGSLKLKKKTIALKQSKLRGKTLSLDLKKALKASGYKGKLKFKKIKGSGKFKINSKNGKLRIKKNTGKGKYKIKLKITASGNKYYSPVSKTITLSVKVQ